LAELLPQPFAVAPKLRLVPNPRQRNSREDSEVRFRFPSEEEVWEVSCGQEGSDETPEQGLATELHDRSRRAS